MLPLDIKPKLERDLAWETILKGIVSMVFSKDWHASALHFFHNEHNITHRERKPESVLFDQHKRVKLVDLGFAKKFGSMRNIAFVEWIDANHPNCCAVRLSLITTQRRLTFLGMGTVVLLGAHLTNAFFTRIDGATVP